MRTLTCVKSFEHIHIIYEGGEVSLNYREDHQTIKKHLKRFSIWRC